MFYKQSLKTKFNINPKIEIAAPIAFLQFLAMGPWKWKVFAKTKNSERIVFGKVEIERFRRIDLHDWKQYKLQEKQ